MIGFDICGLKVVFAENSFDSGRPSGLEELMNKPKE